LSQSGRKPERAVLGRSERPLALLMELRADDTEISSEKQRAIAHSGSEHLRPEIFAKY